MIFVNPYQDDLCLIGTTDIPYEGRAEDVSVDDEEIDYLLAAVNRYIKCQLTPATMSCTASPACGRFMTTTPPIRPR